METLGCARLGSVLAKVAEHEDMVVGMAACILDSLDCAHRGGSSRKVLSEWMDVLRSPGRKGKTVSMKGKNAI